MTQTNVLTSFKLSKMSLPQVLLQPSTRRSYSMQEYEAAGAILSENISEADTIMGDSLTNSRGWAAEVGQLFRGGGLSAF